MSNESFALAVVGYTEALGLLEAGVPVSFDVLTNEIRGLALNLELVRRGDSRDMELLTAEPRAVGTK